MLAKPPVRKLARDLGVDLRTLVGSGPQGSITRDDVAGAPAARPSRPRRPAPSRRGFGADREQRIPVKGVRKLTAENMVATAFTAPHVTEFLTVDVTRSMKALDRLKAGPSWRDVRVSPLLLVAKAVLLAVWRHPMVNSTWAGATRDRRQGLRQPRHRGGHRARPDRPRTSRTPAGCPCASWPTR